MKIAVIRIITEKVSDRANEISSSHFGIGRISTTSSNVTPKAKYMSPRLPAATKRAKASFRVAKGFASATTAPSPPCAWALPVAGTLAVGALSATAGRS